MAGFIGGQVEIIADFNKSTDNQFVQMMEEEILSLLKRRPCSLDDISGGLILHKNEILKCLENSSDEFFIRKFPV